MLSFSINGDTQRLRKKDWDLTMPLLWYLRDYRQLRGTKFGCGAGLCGACTVHQLDEKGQPTAIRACITPLGSLEGAKLQTIETVRDSKVGKELIKNWVAHQVPQCGYCQPGQIMSAAAFLEPVQDKVPADPDEAITQAMSGNLCRCGTYPRIRQALRNTWQGLAGER